MTGNQTCRTFATERRFAFERRRRVAEMSEDEMRQALLTSEVTGFTPASLLHSAAFLTCCPIRIVSASMTTNVSEITERLRYLSETFVPGLWR